MRPSKSTVSKMAVLALVSTVLIVSNCLAVDGIRIKLPSTTSLTSGGRQSFSGDCLAARKKNAAGAIEVIVPKVRLEFWVAGFVYSPYLITSTQVNMEFPVDYPGVNADRGAWSGELTITQQNGEVYPYYLFADGLNAFNDVVTTDFRDYAVVKGN